MLFYYVIREAGNARRLVHYFFENDMVGSSANAARREKLKRNSPVLMFIHL